MRRCARLADGRRPSAPPRCERTPQIRPHSIRQDATPSALLPLRRQNPREEPGALGGARRDLSGGRGAILVPTATARFVWRPADRRFPPGSPNGEPGQMCFWPEPDRIETVMRCVRVEARPRGALGSSELINFLTPWRLRALPQ